jgi:hypothetical protein
MPAATMNLFIEQGASYHHEYRWDDNTNNPVDLTGYTARMQMRSAITIEATVLDMTTENDMITVGGINGIISFDLDAETTADIDWPSGRSTQLIGVYQLELVSPGGFVTRLLKGTVTVDPEVTR